MRFFSATFLRLLELLRNSFIATAKTSVTAKTLGEMWAKLFNIMLSTILFEMVDKIFEK
jgi:hypothetical protein